MSRKILMPYKVQNGISIHSSVVSGGIEMFAKNIYKHIEGIIPIEITEEDRKTRKTKQKMIDAISHYKPDMVLSNGDEPVYMNLPLSFGIPVSTIVHSPASANIRYVHVVEYLKQFTESSGHLYFVSQVQLDVFNSVSKRVQQCELSDIKGFVNPAFSSGTESPNETINYPCLTIGRNESLKDPFFIHRKLKNTPDIKTTVCTSLGKYLKGDIHNEYYDSNLHWQVPRETFRGLSHAENMEKLSQAGCFVSTCAFESWGITALEALSRGIPLILVSQKLKHASTTIAVDPSHYTCIEKSKMKESEFADLVRSLNEIPYKKRLEISELTKEKHSLENWKRDIENIISYRLDTKNDIKTNGLLNFFG